MFLLNLISLLYALLHISPLVRASALTTAIAANERLCFYADVDKAGEKIGVCSFPLLSPPNTKLTGAVLFRSMSC